MREGRFHGNADGISILDSHHFVCEEEKMRCEIINTSSLPQTAAEAISGGGGAYTAELRADQGVPPSPLLGWQLIKAWSLVLNKRDFSMEGKL